MRPHERFINCSKRGLWYAIIQLPYRPGFANFRCNGFDVFIKR